MARPQDPRITQAVLGAVLELLREQSFADVTMDEIAERAGVGKPAIYRRFPDKAALVTAAIARMLTPMSDPPEGDRDPRAELRALVEVARPDDPAGYAALLGALMAEHRRHPELIATFRERVLAPRRAVVHEALRAGQRLGVVRADLDPEVAVDLFGGAFLARVFAGLPTHATWREEMFACWWASVKA